MGKNIVVLSDGTGQEGGEGNNTNVYKLFNMVLDRTPEQIAFYDRGLGTGWRKVSGNVGGAGISKNILECYRFVFDHYEAGDRVFLFGFSRGAATVRSLSGFIHLFGILPKSRPELIQSAYDIYKIRKKKKREAAAASFIVKHHTMWARIAFLGVWDTVAALGVPSKSVDVVLDKIPFLKHRFHDFGLSPSVEAAYQALAVDDERRTFHPVFWDAQIAAHQKMEQVWFCGMHTDVGGGYREPELADIALEWMIEKAKGHGLELYTGHSMPSKPDPNGLMHNSRGGRLTRLYRRKARSWPRETHGDPTVHESVTLRTLNCQNENTPPYSPWILNAPYKHDV